MKKIDLTTNVSSRLTKDGVTVKLFHKNFYDIHEGKYTLLSYVTEALLNYTNASILDAENVLNLIATINITPVVELDDAQITLIEDAITSTNVAVKATWNKMISQLNKEV